MLRENTRCELGTSIRFSLLPIIFFVNPNTSHKHGRDIRTDLKFVANNAIAGVPPQVSFNLSGTRYVSPEQISMPAIAQSLDEEDVHTSMVERRNRELEFIRQLSQSIKDRR